MPAGLGSSLQRCDMDTSGSSKSEDAAEGGDGTKKTDDDETVPAPMKRPATKQPKNLEKQKTMMMT